MSELREQYKALIRKCRLNPKWFVQKMIVDPYNEATGEKFLITKQQGKGFEELSKLVQGKLNKDPEYKKILGLSIMSGKGTGKDAFSSWAILWFMFCFPNCTIPCVSVSADQLDKVLWGEISKWFAYCLLKEVLVLQTTKLYRKDLPPDKEDIVGKKWFAFKKAANPKESAEAQVETLQGIHEEYIMELVDEASGVQDSVFEALENNMTGKCNFMLLIFNPMRSKGYAVRTQYEDKKYWITLRWNSEESEITNKDKIEALKERRGVDSNPYRVNVLGLPPLVDEETLIPWDWIQDAIGREIIITEDMPTVGALDCGAGGDKSVAAMRRGNKVYDLKKTNTKDSVVLANWAGNYIDHETFDSFRVDTIGIGWAVEGMLREKKGALVESADSRCTADQPERFQNKRAEMYWNLRDQFENKTISIPNDPDLLEQLGVIKCKINKTSGKTQIIEKDAIKAEIGHSNDELDAVAMLYYSKDDIISLNKKRYANYEPETKGTWMR